MNRPPTETCGVCLAETSLPVRVDARGTPLQVGGKLVENVCVLCAAELGLFNSRPAGDPNR